MPVPPTLVFDLDGTLVDTAPDLTTTLNHVLAATGAAPVSREEAEPMIGDGIKALIERGLAARSVETDAAEFDRLFGLALDFYAAHIADESRPFAGAVAALDRFRARGWRLAICTNKLEALSRGLVGALGIADRFAAIAGGDSFGVKKPDPAHLLSCIRAAGGDPGQSIMVGDSANDIRTARAAGVPVIAVDFGYTPVPVTALGPDRVISHFDALDAAVGELAPWAPPITVAFP